MTIPPTISSHSGRKNNGTNEHIAKWICKLQGGFPPYMKMNDFERETIRMIFEAIYMDSSSSTARDLHYQMIFARLHTMSNESVSIAWGILFGFLSEVIDENELLENEIEILRTKIAHT